MQLSQIEGGGYIEENGEFPVTVISNEAVESQVKRTPGVKFIFRADDNRTKDYTFWISPEANKYIRIFADACNLTQAEMCQVDTDYRDSFGVFCGKRVVIRVREDKDGYFKIRSFRRPKEGEGSSRPAPMSAPSGFVPPQQSYAPPVGSPVGAPEDAANGESEDDLPF
jgi:hypothetical protein